MAGCVKSAWLLYTGKPQRTDLICFHQLINRLMLDSRVRLHKPKNCQNYFYSGGFVNVLLPVIIFVSWLAFVLVPAGRLAIEDAQTRIPDDKRRGTSIFPGFPLFPLMAWGAALACDQFISAWGNWLFLVAHLVLLSISVVIIVRDLLRLRKMED